MNPPLNHLFVVVIAVLPTEAQQREKSFPWALLRFWMRTESADSALARVREMTQCADFQSRWELATRQCQVNLASQWRGPIPTAGIKLTETGRFVIEEDRAPETSELPDFETVFRADPLTTLTI